MATDALTGRPWVLLPGTLCTGAVFDGFLDALAVPRAHRQTVLLRHPDVADYAAVLGQVATGAVICGFSLGAIVAAHHADAFAPERLILFGLNPHADDPQKAQGRRDLARDVARLGGAAALGSRLPPFGGPDPAGAHAAVLAMADQAAADIGAQTALALTRPGALPALSRTTVPVSVISGAEDALARPADAQTAAQAAPRGRFRALAGLGHYALVEDPAACAMAVRAMLHDDPAPG